MSNNKQSSVKMLWMEIDNLIPYTNEKDSQLFRELLIKYEAIHKEESITYARNFANQMLQNKRFVTAEIIYNETFNTKEK